MWHQPIRRTFSLYLLRCFAERKCLRLSKNIGDQHVVMPAKRIQCLRESNEVAWDEPCPLVNQLVERVLTVRPRLAPVDGTRLVSYLFPVECDVLAVALHCQLLEISRKALQVLLIRQDRHCLCAEEIVIPD